jgi:hypothetical protein
MENQNKDRIRFELDLRVSKAIAVEAMEIGITQGDLIRFILGSWAKDIIFDDYKKGQPIPAPGPGQGMMYATPVQLPDEVIKRIREQADSLTSFDGKEIKAMNMINKYLVLDRLKAGDIKCLNCTMPLKWEDFKETQKCSSCGAPVDIDELRQYLQERDDGQGTT